MLCNTRSTLALSFWLLCALATAKKPNRNAPHAHSGLLKAHQPGPFPIVLSNADEAELNRGNSVMKQTMPAAGEEAGTVLCVQDIDAPMPAVWNQILDLGAYKGKVPKVSACDNYICQKNHDGTFTVKTRMVLGVMPGYSYENYYNHRYLPEDSSMVWSLDYEKTSDFDDVAGHWHVAEHPSKPSHTRVFYACDVQMKGNLPKPIINYIGKAALKQATSWVKKEAEQNQKATPPAPFDECFSAGGDDKENAAPAGIGKGIRKPAFFGSRK
jgi:hypothetical protein